MASTGLLGFNPYNRGVKGDFTSKPTNVAIQLIQHQKAQDEALDKYFMDYDKNLNPAGMRTQDTNVLMDKMRANKDFYFKYKDQIKHPEKYGSQYYNQFIMGNKEALGLIDQSKQLAANGKVLSSALLDAKKNNKTIPQEVKDSIFQNELSIGDPNHKSFDIMNFDAYDKHDPIKYQQALYSRIKRSEGKPERTLDPKTNEVYYKTVKDITPESFNQLQYEVSGDLKKDRGFADTVREIAADENKVKKLSTIFEKFSNGRKMKNTLEDIGLAYSLALKPEAEVSYTTPKEDPRLARMEEDRLIRKRREDFGDEGGTQEHIFDQFGSGGQPINLGTDKSKNSYRIIQGQIVDQKGNPASITTTITGENLPKDFFDIISKDSPNKLSADMDYTITSKNGKITNIATESGNIDRETARAKQQRYDKKIKVAPETSTGENVQELKGSVNPRNLKKGNKYKVDGVVYTFDGKNLIP